MTTAALRWTRSGLTLAALLALAACAQVPVSQRVPPPKTVVRITLSPPAETTAAAPSSAVPSSSHSASEAGAGGSAGAANALDHFSARTPEPLAGINPADYADLFSRIRAGFELPELANRRITRQLNWFVDNPDWVQRAFGRAQLYLYSIVTQVEARHMPLEIALLPVIESAYQPYAYSRARAVGLWQFMPQTARRFGLKLNWWYDGRRDVVESTRAALDYLQYLHTEFNGDWLLAIAAYDCGEATVSRAVRENERRGRPTDFWHLRLPRETRAYVPKLLAMRDLVESPEAYGLSFSPIPNKPYFTRVATHGPIDLDVAAEIAGVSPKVIYQLNPAFHRWATGPTGPFYLLVPTGAAATFRANIGQLTADERLRVRRYTVQRGDTLYRVARHFHVQAVMIRELNGLSARQRLVIGSDLEIPSHVDVHALPRKVLLAAARVDARYRRIWRPTIRVVVHPGDSLWEIARRHHMNVDTLARINGLRLNETLHVGERLRLWLPASMGGIVVHRGDSLWEIARRHHMNVRTLARINGLRLSDPLRAGERLRLTTHVAYHRPEAHRATADRPAHSFRRRVTYVVRAGDTLYHISRVFQVSVRELMNWNRLARSNLWPGQHLRILLAQR